MMGGMLTIYNDRHALHQGKVEMFRGELVPCFEVPARVDHVKHELERRGLGPLQAPMPSTRRCWPGCTRRATWTSLRMPGTSGWRSIRRTHRAMRCLRTGPRAACAPTCCRRAFLRAWGCSPSTRARRSWPAAGPPRATAPPAPGPRRSVAGGERAAFALTRPPGHHAGADFFGGYCFVNNAAVAAQALRDAGVERVAVLDVDYHHGNGTQAIFYERSDVHFASLHGDPLTDYPYYLGHADERGAGAGLGFNHNLPLARGTGFAAWRAALKAALDGIAAVRAGALVVSLGVDTFEGDPVAGFRLQSDDYLRMGEDLARAGLPTVFVFEGGYAVAEVGVNAVNVLQGFEQQAAG